MTTRERLKELREKKGVSQTVIGNLLGVGQPTIAKYESGILEIPSGAIIIFSDYFGVTTDYLLKGKE